MGGDVAIPRCGSEEPLALAAAAAAAARGGGEAGRRRDEAELVRLLVEDLRFDVCLPLTAMLCLA
jgi:hypothetical protein